MAYTKLHQADVLQGDVHIVRHLNVIYYYNNATRVSTFDLDFWSFTLTSNPLELWSWPIHMQKVKVRGHLVQKLRVKTDGRRKLLDWF